MIIMDMMLILTEGIGEEDSAEKECETELEGSGDQTADLEGLLPSPCDICKTVINTAYGILGKNSTKAAIEGALGKVCNKLPWYGRSVCKWFVKKFTKNIISSLENHLPASTICKKLGLCRGTSNNLEMIIMDMMLTYHEMQRIGEMRQKRNIDEFKSPWEEDNKEIESETGLERSGRCSEGFILDGDVCYYLSTEKRTWNESSQWCRDKQSDLIIINYRGKEALLGRVVPRHQAVWIGLTNSNSGGWMWVNGAPLTSPTFWAPGQPTGRGGDGDCGYYYTGLLPSRGWFDDACRETYYWMCEKRV